MKRVATATAPQEPQAGASEFASLLLSSCLMCARIDVGGVIRDATPSLRGIIRNIVGLSVEKAFGIDAHALFAATNTNEQSPIGGIYESADGQLVPVILTPVYGATPKRGGLVIHVADGLPFRQADMERLKTVPYAMVRLQADGSIQFANSAATALFEREAKDLVGLPLVDFFAPSDRLEIESKVAACSSGRATKPLEVTAAASLSVSGELLSLALLPDPAPDGGILGVVAAIRPLSISDLKDSIRRIAIDPQHDNWRDRLRLILQRLRTILPFDHANFGMYAERTTLFRAFFLDPPNSFTWPSRWVSVPPGIDVWVVGPDTCISDVEEFVNANPDLKKMELSQLYIKEGIRSSVTLPVIGGTGSPTSALSFCSRKKNTYQLHHLEKLRELGLESILIRIEEDIQAERDNVCDKVEELLATNRTLWEIGTDIIDLIARHSEWDHVSLFRVDRAAGRFLLIYQVAKDPALKLPVAYEQAFKDEGLLWETLEKNESRIVDDRDGARALGFPALARRFRSAIAAPIHLNGRPRWILLGMGTTAYTFRGPDRAILEKIIDSVERGSTQRLTTEITSKLMHESQQGVAVVGLDGMVLDANNIALSLFGLSEISDIKKPLHDFAGNDHAAQVLKGNLPSSARRIDLRGEDGKLRPVLATRRDLEDAFDTVVWFFADLEFRNWSRELRFLRATVTDVAEQTRGPLLLASTLAHQALDTMSGEHSKRERSKPTMSGFIERALAELRKADITFERLAEHLSMVKEPVRSTELFDLGSSVRDIIQALPKRDQKRINAEDIRRSPVRVAGDRARLEFCIRSILAHLLRCRPDDDTVIAVSLSMSGKERERRPIRLNLGLTSLTTTSNAKADAPTDGLWIAYQQARDDAGLGLQAITKIIEAHGGRLNTIAHGEHVRNSLPPWTQFELKLPRARSDQVLT